jgi:hypothetical protein
MIGVAGGWDGVLAGAKSDEIVRTVRLFLLQLLVERTVLLKLGARLLVSR